MNKLNQEECFVLLRLIKARRLELNLCTKEDSEEYRQLMIISGKIKESEVDLFE